MKKVIALTLALMMTLALAACGSSDSGSSAPAPAASAAPSGTASEPADADGTFTTVTEGKFTVGMECAYAPFNWTQLEQTETAVDIGSASFADGYDVVVGKYIADKLGLELVVKPIAWEGLEPAVNNGEIDAIIAGMTATPERAENVDFTTPYYESKMVIIVRGDSDLVNVTDIQELSGKKVQGQTNTLYDTVIDQIEGVDHVTSLATYPLMVAALQNKEVDALTAELPVAVGVVTSNPDLKYVEFEPDKGFQADTSVSIAVKKGNSALLEAVQGALDSADEETRQQWMIDATNRQPSQE
ncbi:MULTISPECIES: transporter substrate-binding domain-containing protein [Anaerotruncus]|jgi:putative lysine transport system substrate-binding protein|uniref:transporter substrate-binding domain-containing protein n=1 Tax=Anaerotruncus TaxID=244127 RepID=UPI0008341D27|nr:MULTISPECIES: transporter substrate-binding domain-containing protein [Anaerotruncus]RGX55847.1 ABC transporter substrate-binding protein [Anaerotruncus sp. AF02-27]